MYQLSNISFRLSFWFSRNNYSKRFSFIQPPVCSKSEKLGRMFVNKLKRYTNNQYIFIVLWQTRKSEVYSTFQQCRLRRHLLIKRKIRYNAKAKYFEIQPKLNTRIAGIVANWSWSTQHVSIASIYDFGSHIPRPSSYPIRYERGTQYCELRQGRTFNILSSTFVTSMKFAQKHFLYLSN